MTSINLKNQIYLGSLLELNNSYDFNNVDNIIILSSPSVVKNTAIQSFIALLGNRAKVYDKIRPDAPIQDLEIIENSFNKPDLIIGIGGGSVIDSAKGLSLGWQNNSSLIDYFYKRCELPNKSIPVFAVPTTAGTGAELSYGAILYDTVGNVKSGIRSALIQPQKVIIDVNLYKTAPTSLIAETGFDCLTHAIETYISTASSAFVRYQSISAIQIIFKNLREACNKDTNALESMALAATLMGLNLAFSTTCLPHRIQYVIGPLTSTSHAQGLIMLYNGWLEVIKDTKPFHQLAEDLGMNVPLLINNIQKLKQDLNLTYKLGHFGVTSDQIEGIALQVQGNMNNDPSYKSTETIINILNKSL